MTCTVCSSAAAAPAGHQGLRGGGGVAELCTFTGRVSDDELCRILSSADLGVDPEPRNVVGQEHDEQDHGVHVLRAADRRLRAHREPRLRRAGRPVRRAEPERALARRISRPARRPHRKAPDDGPGFGRERVRHELAWEYSAPVLLAAYDRLWPAPAAAASSTWTRRPGPDRPARCSHAGNGARRPGAATGSWRAAGCYR